MTELINNAGLGWQDFTDAGKFAALLAASLIFLWMSGRKKTQRTLLIYTTVGAVCCVFPLTAAGLMLYQTKFYDYQWIWSLVPMTAVIAYGAVCIMDEYWPGFRLSEWKKGLPVLILLLAVLLLSSGMETLTADGAQVQKRAAAGNTLKQVQAEMGGEKICLWAPAEILEYARETDASIELLYGRNMWDKWLNAYAYDTYSEEMLSLYEWMEEAALAGRDEAAAVEKETGTDTEVGEDKSFGANKVLGLEISNDWSSMKIALEKVDTALKAGANCILLPESLDESIIKGLEKKLSVRAVSVGGYYLLIA